MAQIALYLDPGQPLDLRVAAPFLTAATIELAQRLAPYEMGAKEAV